MKQVIERRGWCRGSLADGDGRVCLLGAHAVAKAGLNGAERDDVYEARESLIDLGQEEDRALMLIRKAVRENHSLFDDSIPHFNDAIATDQQEVINTIDQAIAKA